MGVVCRDLQRPAPRHNVGVTDDGLVERAAARSAGARYSLRARRAQGPSAARPHVPGRHVQGPPRRGRGDQGRAGVGAPLRGSGCRPTRSASTSCTARIDAFAAAARRAVTQQREVRLHRTRSRCVVTAPMAGTAMEFFWLICGLGHGHRRAVRPPAKSSTIDDEQLFAQVTNPPLDALREELVTSLAATIGPEANLRRGALRGRARQILLLLPVRSTHAPPGQAWCMSTSTADAGHQGLRHRRAPLRRPRRLDGSAAPTEAGVGEALRRAIDEVRRCNPRPPSPPRAPTSPSSLTATPTPDRAHPVPLLTAAVHHHLVRREAPCTKVGPWSAIPGDASRGVPRLRRRWLHRSPAPLPSTRTWRSDSTDDMISEGRYEALPVAKARRNYIKRGRKGVLKVCPRWASRPWPPTPAPRSSRPSGSMPPSSTSTSPGRRRASAASASPCWPPR